MVDLRILLFSRVSVYPMPKGDPTSTIGFRANENLRRRLEFLAAERKMHPASLVKAAVEAAIEQGFNALATSKNKEISP